VPELDAVVGLDHLSYPQSARSCRRILALALVTVAACMLVAEPFPEGAVLVSLTRSHGVDAGDLPALGLLLLAGWFAHRTPDDSFLPDDKLRR
jgi:hypothetical protein